MKATIVFFGGGEEEISWREASSEDGTFLTDQSDRKQRIWYLAKRQMSAGDGIRIEVKTASRGKGRDNYLTQDLLYAFDPAAPVQEVASRGILMNGFHQPLVKGRIIEIAQETARDKIEQEICEFIDGAEKRM